MEVDSVDHATIQARQGLIAGHWRHQTIAPNVDFRTTAHAVARKRKPTEPRISANRNARRSAGTATAHAAVSERRAADTTIAA